MKIINARLRGRSGLFTIDIDAGTIRGIDLQPSPLTSEGDDVIDAGSHLVIPPLVEPHIHLDATLTAGEPEWN
ncbi:MAG: cytosine deaminase, partial [Proteobacteria bacterium]|nr:cytosine deaminase [Pseudomonadota bacterium]